MRHLSMVVLSFLLLTPTHSWAQADEPQKKIQLDKIQLPPGFKIRLFTDQVPNARSMTLGKQGTLFVGTRVSGDEGKVYAVLDAGSGKAGKVVTIASGLQMPNGVAFRDGSLYVAEVSRVIRYDDIEEKLKAGKPVGDPVVVNASFPKDTYHGWKYLAFGPDGWLYVPVGAPCNVCERQDPRYASIMRMKPDGSELSVYASGIRNSVGFDWNPADNVLWFTNNGRDLLGDNLPPDELQAAPKAGMNFGFPYCHSGRIPDPEFGSKKSCSEFTAPKRELKPHVAALGMKFYKGSSFPKEYRGDIFIAEHGSWNRSVPDGYRITHVKVENGNATSYDVFAQGWLQGRSPWGRPVDVLVLGDGSMLVSDDLAGAIYQISYGQ